MHEREAFLEAVASKGVVDEAGLRAAADASSWVVEACSSFSARLGEANEAAVVERPLGAALTRVELPPVALVAAALAGNPEGRSFGNAWAEETRGAVRRRKLAYKTEKSYVVWVERFVAWWRGRESEVEEIGREEALAAANAAVRGFLDSLAIERGVAASTQDQALNALAFLFNRALRVELGDFSWYEKARERKKAPTWLTGAEMAKLLARLDGTEYLVSCLMFGAGLRLSEAIRLRVQDLDFEDGVITVRSGKGGKDRRVPLPKAASERLRLHLERVRLLHGDDLAEGFGEVYLPGRLGGKLKGAAKDWGWQYVFPASKRSIDPRGGRERRHHVSDAQIQRAVRKAKTLAGLHKRVTPHVLRHSFATQLVRSRVDIRTIQELMGHDSVETTMIYTHALNRPGVSVDSPLDDLTRGEEGIGEL